ncbi:hypothetical protein [Amycolatopsis sp. FDAARGOS 1241]|uniref:hypothetical protein n=1 Tax=Amycolatopsis sp. FDAARGOS 1241 TaxID=2778070 RepID=UPI0019524AA5|nr:hypothetical protein [Amycolatopsis sp. FDAARGOS 1241]QRP46448.1 hypothetical protein I6J71_46920 [Amycolatopsis sp. FDAARGOS 1241]
MYEAQQPTSTPPMQPKDKSIRVTVISLVGTLGTALIAAVSSSITSSVQHQPTAKRAVEPPSLDCHGGEGSAGDIQAG